MKCLYKNKTHTEIKEIIENDLKDGEVKIDVLISGVCRTDIYVYQNIIKNEDLILGHECCGYISKSKSINFKKGDFVTINPFLKNHKMIGVDLNGCFAESIIIDSSQVHKIPELIEPKLGAYIEPITASLSPLNSKNIKHNMKILIMGKGRIAELTKLVMSLSGFTNLHLSNSNNNNNSLFDCVIETGINNSELNNIPNLLKNNGLLIIKSRDPKEKNINFYNFVKKNITIECLYYYDFNKSIEFTIKNKNAFNHLFGKTYCLSDWKKAFKDNENKKIFISPKGIN